MAAGGAGGDAGDAGVVGGSAEVGEVLFGEDEGESGMHGWTSFRGVVWHCDLRGLQRACSPVNAPARHRNRGWVVAAACGGRRAADIGTVTKAYAFRHPGTATGDR
jgi:hypothetical protein